jgi:hypothetical protein
VYTLSELPLFFSPSPLVLQFVGETIRDNKKNIAFCWFEIRIAIQKDP